MELNFIISAIICLKSSQLNLNFHLKSCANSDLHTGLECIRSYTRRCMSQHEREHFNKLYFGTNEMIKDLCSEGAYQEGTYVIFNLIKIQFTRNCISFKFHFYLILFYYTFNFETKKLLQNLFTFSISIMTDFLRYAPCMRKVKNEYEMCSDSYKNNMKKIHEEKSGGEAYTTPPPTTTSTTTSAPPRLVQISLMKRQQSSQSIYVSLETTTINSVKNSSTDAIDQGEVQIKTVCWYVSKLIS